MPSFTAQLESYRRNAEMLEAMRFTGRLKSWNDDRGFGFIEPTEGGQDIFVHISDCPKGRKPNLQETLTFEVALNREGKKKAVNVRGAEREANSARRERGYDARERMSRESAGGFMAGVIALAILGAIAWYGYRQYGGGLSAAAAVPTPADRTLLQTDSPAISHFSCDGRKYCSQMTSCAEATFFLKNCPGVQMDGDHDGVPCEQQWCR